MLRDASERFARMVLRSRQTTIEVTSWLGAEPLGEVPVVLGSWEIIDAEDEQVPGEIRFDVPNNPEWRPVGNDHPLARFGQQVQIRVGIVVRGEPELLNMGRFRITEVNPDGEVISVTAQGLLVNVERARFLAPYTVKSGTTRQAAIQRMLQGILPVAFDVPDETMPTGTWERERIDALQEIVQAWPARIWVDDTGVAVVSEPWPDAISVADVEYTFAAGANLLAVNPSPTPERDFNGYVVSTVPEGDEAPVTGQYLLPFGPMAWGGPYGFNPGFYASPVLPPDANRLAAIAKTMTERSRRRNDTVDVSALPDPRVTVGTTAWIRSPEYEALGRITRVQHTRTLLKATLAVTA